MTVSGWFVQAVKMNPDMKTRASEIAVGPTTEHVFNDDFWKSRDIVVNALDNIEARNYVDERCVFYCKPMLDSGTLGTKANTQVVIPFKTECYRDNADGADEKDAIPMCTIRELPYLPEHCIEWARSLFAGEFFDAVRGAAAFRESPAEWLATQRENCIQNPQPDAIRQVLTTLRTAIKPTYSSCLTYARLLFNSLFYAKIRTVTHACPRDFVQDGGKYWTGRRRFPDALDFTLTDELHHSFVVHTTALAAQVFGVELPTGWSDPVRLSDALAGVGVPEWAPTAIKVGDDAKGEALSEYADPASAAAGFLKGIEELVTEIGGPTALASLTLHPQEFEKDDDTNHHVDFIAAATNLRASNFHIPLSDRLTVRITAGRIIPAIATTTCMITGLVAVELYKIIADRVADAFRNTFVNMATNAYQLAEPAGPKRVRSRKHSITYSGPVRAHPEGFTRWDYIEFKGGKALTPLVLEKFFSAEHGLNLHSLSFSDKDTVKKLFISKLAKHRTERGEVPLADIYASVLKKEADKYLLLNADVSDATSPVQVPLLRLHLE